MIFQKMTWTELKEVDFSRTTVLIPTGAMEQHGPHLPVDTDTLLVTKLAEEAERRNTGTLLLAPTVWLGHSPHHLSFGGTLSAQHQVYIQMIVSVCRSFIGMGAERIWLLNGHGGNHNPLSIVLQELKNDYAPVVVVASEYWSIAREEIAEIRESGLGGLGHACELETSLYLYLNGDQVRRERIQDDGIQPDSPLFHIDMQHGTVASRVYNFRELTSSGVFGRPTLATVEKGERLFRAISDKLQAFADQIHALGRSNRP
ncbi:creatininase family protein [Paenibacillus koleovorans]|uniref:creatininase family protein n=1 Tax=Paenibacillus koleovorans TaxID=121608 RepID=UPI001FE32BA5|nr:creatininase family protein [Paenibacillus koleovorans]